MMASKRCSHWAVRVSLPGVPPVETRHRMFRSRREARTRFNGAFALLNLCRRDATQVQRATHDRQRAMATIGARCLARLMRFPGPLDSFDAGATRRPRRFVRYRTLLGRSLLTQTIVTARTYCSHDRT